MKNKNKQIKINNIPNEHAVNKFTYTWQSSSDNDNLRDEEYNNTNNLGITTKFIKEYCKICDGDGFYGYSAFMIIVIFVKEYNAYYFAEYTRQYSGDEFNYINADSNVIENELDFKIIPTGKFIIPDYNRFEAKEKSLCDDYDMLNGLVKN